MAYDLRLTCWKRRGRLKKQPTSLRLQAISLGIDLAVAKAQKKDVGDPTNRFNMGIIVRLLGSGLGMASEAIQYVEPRLGTIAGQQISVTRSDLQDTNMCFVLARRVQHLARHDLKVSITDLSDK